MARRHALSPLARDVERGIGRTLRASSEATLRQILGPLLRDAGSAPKPIKALPMALGEPAE